MVSRSMRPPYRGSTRASIPWRTASGVPFIASDKSHRGTASSSLLHDGSMRRSRLRCSWCRLYNVRQSDALAGSAVLAQEAPVNRQSRSFRSTAHSI